LKEKTEILFDKKLVTSNRTDKLSENSTSKSKIKQRRKVQEKNRSKSVETNQRYLKGIKYLSGIAKGVIIYLKVNTYTQIAEQVCNHIFKRDLDLSNNQKKKNRDLETKNIYRRVYDCLNMMAGVGIIRKNIRIVTLAENVFRKEVY